MQIDKTVTYRPTASTVRGFLFLPVAKGNPYFSNVAKNFALLINNLFNQFLASEYSIVRVIILSTASVCFMMGAMGTDDYWYQPINFFQAFFGAAMMLMSYLDFGKKNIRYLGNLFIYVINISNALLIATSHFNDKLSYQYIIYFFVSSLFFINKRSLITCIILNSLTVLVLAFLPSQNSTSVFDFYLCFAGAEFGLLLLMLKRFKVEAKLKENELHYRLLAENSADVICTHTMRGEFEFVSPSIVALTGYQPSELIGKFANPFVYPADRALYARMMIQSKTAAVSDTFQYRFLTKSGTYMWVETVVKSLQKQTGIHEAGFLSQTRSFQSHHEYLEQIERHTMELQDSYKDLEMFSYISSHDMQEPLRMISNYMQLLDRRYHDKLDKDAVEFIDYAMKGASNLQALIKDLLSYSTINKKEIKVTTIDVKAVLDEVLSGLQLLIKERQVKVYMAEALHPLIADKNAMAQLLQNLIENGIKYNLSDNPIIRITSKEDGRYVTYCVADNGIGIDKEYAQQIFEPFRRLHTKHDFPGTGLGLSICRKIADRLNGRIWVESVAGEGSSFYICIPK